MLNNRTACFFGHRYIEKTNELKNTLYCVIENLIIEKNVNTFLFGSKSKFNNFCHEIVTELKQEKYPDIKRIFVRAEYPYINEDYKRYLLQFYEDSYYPETLLGANRAVYVKRNYLMIDSCQYCIVYYNSELAPTTRKSGTKIALDYALKKKKEIIHIIS